MEPVFALLMIAAVLAFVVFAFVSSAKRRKEYQELAARLRMTYTPKDRALPREFKFLDGLRKGHSQYAANILTGQYREYPVMFFDYHYTTGSGKNQQHHTESFFMLKQERPWPELRIYPEGVFSKFGQMLGFDDIDFESLEFSKAFVVKSPNKKFAYDICHTRMMEFLLQHRDVSLEIEDRYLALSCNRALRPDQCTERLNLLIAVRELFPRYLYET